MYWKTASVVFCATILLTACRDDGSARVYKVPKEEPAARPTMQMPASANQAGGSMANQTLPAELLNQSAILPAWDVPASWQEVAPSSMRMASFEVREGAELLDISVTSFPGDVGGLTANVNRWRGQLNLPPSTPEAIEQSAQTLRTLSGDATVLEFSNGSVSTLVATLRHDGASWFVKMTGPAALAEREAQNFRAFVRSIDFAATHNH